VKERKDTAMLPFCDHKGCWEHAAVDHNVVHTFGTNLQPVRVVLSDGETYSLCPTHLARLRNWLQNKDNNERTQS
jgi:hypothetical protein